MSLESRVAQREEGNLGAIALDSSLRIVCVSAGVLRLSGFEASQLAGRSPIDLVHPDDASRAADVLDEVLSLPGDRSAGLYRLRVADGSYEAFTVRATNLGADEDHSIIMDFSAPTPQVRAEAFADDAVDAMRLLSDDITLDQSLNWVAQVAERHVDDLQIVITMFEPGRPNRLFSRAPIPEAIQQVNATATATSLPIHVEVAFDEYSQRRWRASRKIASLDYIVPGRLTSVLADRRGAIVGYVEALRGTTDAPDDSEWLVHSMISRMMTAVLHRYEFDRQLRDAADLDPLTGLLNRRRLFEALKAEQHLAGSMLYLIDLDRFSWVNNNLGHQAGDETLIAVARALNGVCPSEAMIARLGGDEFVVWIPALQASHNLEVLGDEISKAMVVPAGVGDKRVWVRASIGMVRIEAGEAAADALNRADIAMYASKRGGGDAATSG